jgi:hypothetical protein
MGMALTTVSELRTTLGVGTLYTDAVLQEVCDASDAVLLPMLWNNYTFNVAQSNTTTEGTLYFDESIKDVFYVGQTVTVTGNGAPHNGSKAITGMSDISITYAVTGSPTAQPQHTVAPFGQVAVVATVDYTTDTAIQNAALMISVEIWQARTATLSGSNAVDFQPSPYRMSAQLLAKVRGLIAHALDPRSMVG